MLASIASGWLTEALIWSNFRRATDGRCLDVAHRQAVRIRAYERREAALEAVAPPEWAARTRLALPPLTAPASG